VYENIDVSLFVIDVLPGPVFVYAGANPAHERFTGISQAMIAGRRPEEIHPPGAAAMVKKNYRRCVDEGRMIEYEESLQFEGRETWWMTRLIPLRNTAGEVYRIVGASLHITDLKSARFEAERREQFLATLLDTIPVPVFFKDNEGCYLGSNRAFADFTGYSTAVIKGLKDASLLTGEIAEMHARMDAEIFRQEKPQRFEYVAMDASGSLRSVIYSKNVFREGDEVAGIIGCFMDISEQKQAEDDLRSFTMHDELTGLFKRRALLELCTREIMRSRRDGRALAVIVIVIADMGGYIREYGRKAADDLVAALGGVFDDVARRPGDIAGRMAENVFALVLPQTESVGAHNVALRLQRDVLPRVCPEGHLMPGLCLGICDEDIVQAGRLETHLGRAVRHCQETAVACNEVQVLRCPSGP
jgi:PAS domain S-box-containing protein/diguanylate cyclase (GGDEF)-like protein